MTIQEKIDQTKAIKFAAIKATSELGLQEKSEATTISSAITTVASIQSNIGVFILEELQKMQQPKVCKWTKHKDVTPNSVYRMGCTGTLYVTKQGCFCPNCGGKVEIDKENVQK